MAIFNEALKITGENEGADSSYDQETKWGITKEFLEFHKLKKPASAAFIKAISNSEAGGYVKKVISDKIFNNADNLIDQHIYNLIIDYGFNKPAFCIRTLGKVLNRTNEIPQALESLKIPAVWIQAINAADPKTFYGQLWAEWWAFTINSGTFITGAAGLANRVIRYQNYGSIGKKDNGNAGAKKAYEETTNAKVKAALTKFLGKKSRLTAEKSQNTEGSQWTTIALTLSGIFVGGKILKWW